jgi:hypothetical protein
MRGFNSRPRLHFPPLRALSENTQESSSISHDEVRLKHLSEPKRAKYAIKLALEEFRTRQRRGHVARHPPSNGRAPSRQSLWAFHSVARANTLF